MCINRPRNSFFSHRHRSFGSFETYSDHKDMPRCRSVSDLMTTLKADSDCERGLQEIRPVFVQNLETHVRESLRLTQT